MQFRFCIGGFAVLGLLCGMASLVQPAASANPGLFLAAQEAGSSAQSPDKGAKDKEKEGDKERGEKSPDKTARMDPSTDSPLTPEQRLTYVIGVEDELQISVWREPELSTTVVVRPDGMITLPLINDVKAAGLKTEELQTQLIEKLKNFVNEPQVTVMVRGIKSRKVYLVGEVAHQGTFALNGDMTALELLAAAGGVTPFAKADSIYILREENGKKVRIPFHYKKAVAGKSENVTLRPGDVVVVP